MLENEKEEVNIENLLLKSTKSESAETEVSEFKLLDDIIQDLAPEITHLYQFREDEAEEQQIKTGQLHENRILGIFLKSFLKGKGKITTRKVEDEYKKYFKDIARSTTSTYLNMLKKESTLYTEREGRLVYYKFYEEPPLGIKPFWFTRIFCIVPAYFDRAKFFSNLYNESETYAQEYIKEFGNIDRDTLIQNFKYLIGLIILNIFKNRCSKCMLCQYSKREIYNKLEEIIHTAVRDRSDVLPDELNEELVKKFSELPIFNGTEIKDNSVKMVTAKKIMKSANLYKKDLSFQIMVASKRTETRLKQKLSLIETNTHVMN
ncbi:MAG: hypothetical protein ACFE91_06800 [Promethearchaeota archaeon]